MPSEIKYSLNTIKIIEGAFPDLHETLFVNSQKIGTMKSHDAIFGLALLRTDFTEAHNMFTLDKFYTKLAIV